LSNKNKDIYLVAFYHLKPKPGVNTSQKGWMDNFDNITFDESIEITRGTKKNSAIAKVILNLSKKKIERNSWGTDRSFDEYFKHYFVNYHKYLTTVMTQLDAEYMGKVIDDFQSELDAQKQEDTVNTPE
jgi:hypothetical protein